MDLSTPANLIGFDTETHLIGPKGIAPKLVCITAHDGNEPMIASSGDISSSDEGTHFHVADFLISHLLDGKHSLVAHNAPFDLAVLCNHDPARFSQVFQALEDGRIYDTKTREKLLNLATTGRLTHVDLPGGEVQKIEYSLAALVQKYLGEDRTEAKATIKNGQVVGDNDAWRLNYSVLDGVPSSEWPPAARDYAIQDAQDAYLVWYAQEQRRRSIIETKGIDPLATQAFQVACDFCLFLMTCWGMATDPQAVAALEAHLAEELSDEKLGLLIEAGILRPGEAPRPHANGARNPDGSPKMTAGKAPSIDTKALKALVEKLASDRPGEVTIKMTAPSKKFPEGQISTDTEWLEDHWHLSPVLEQYRHRQLLGKLVTTEIPRMKWEGVVAPVVHPCYDNLKETGRTSSFSSDNYPSFNIQNIDPRARGCYVPRPGCLLFSNDYSALELCTTAQTCINLFGKSVLADKINAGVDPHEYLGAQIAYATHPQFRASCDEEGANTPEAIYQAFRTCKKHEIKEVAEFWKHYRTLAKPTGLGYPGGLGPKTFVKYAKATYGVVVDLETATNLREVWRSAFPEVVEYHKWINEQTDPHNQYRTRVVDGEEKSSPLYHYTSPMGMYRAGCDYCAAANGRCMQTPAAEGAKLAVFNVVRACYDPALSSILYPDENGPTVRPIGFIHDEIVGEVRDDQHAHERVSEVAKIMRESMRVICPDIDIRVGMALMRRWDKDAEAVFDSSGRLTVWAPKPKGEQHVQPLKAAA